MMNFLINNLIESLFSNLQMRNTDKKTIEDIRLYTNKLYEKLRLTKNILFRNKPIDFYENYIPLKLRLDNRILSTQDFPYFIENNKKIIILGAAGCGKTTILKYFAVRSIDEGYRIPIYVELRNFNEERTSFEEFITGGIFNTLPSSDVFNSDKFIFIFDGFDEINFREGKDVITQIEKFISKYSNNIFIISSRQGTNIESLQQFYVYEVEPLTFEDISLYVKKLNLSNRERNAIFENLEHNDIFHQYLTNPLFLSLYINYTSYHSEGRIPQKKSVFFRSILDTLFSQHDSVSKLGFVREKLSGLNKDELEIVASILAYRALVSSTTSFSTDELYNEFERIRKHTKLYFENENIVYDLTITVNILVNNFSYYSFSHIVFLEYLASLFISRLAYDKKANVYNQFLRKRNMILSITLLNFLMELDLQAFLKYFLIPYIENALNNDYRRESDSQVYAFLAKLYNPASQNSYLNDVYLTRNELREILSYLLNQLNIDEIDDIDDIDELLRMD